MQFSTFTFLFENMAQPMNKGKLGKKPTSPHTWITWPLWWQRGQNDKICHSIFWFGREERGIEMKKPKFRYCRRGKQLQLKIATDLKIKETCFLQPVCSISDRNKATLQKFLTVGFFLKIVPFPKPVRKYICASLNQGNCQFDEILRGYSSNHYFQILRDHLSMKKISFPFCSPASFSFINN